MPGALDALLHPVRWRIVQALGRRPLTARELLERLPGIPQATLYRHIPPLVDAGLIEVLEQQQVRGAVERTYALTGPVSAESGDAEGFRRGALHVLALLQADLERVAAGAEDGVLGVGVLEQVSATRSVIHATPDEMARLRDELRGLIEPLLEGGEGRAPHVLGLVLAPEL